MGQQGENVVKLRIMLEKSLKKISNRFKEKKCIILNFKEKSK